jgi:hypothetical protein
VSAVDDLRATVIAGEATDLTSRAVIELADRVAQLEASVFPAPSPAVRARRRSRPQPITTERPQLSGSGVDVEEGSV